MQFRVPQFIEVEDKIFGPFTFRQFLYLVGGLGISFLIYRILPFFVALILIIPVIALSAALAFYKVNGKPFILVIESFIKFSLSSKLYLWKKVEKKAKEEEKSAEGPPAFVPKLSDSKLRDLSWSLDVLDLNKPTSSQK